MESGSSQPTVNLRIAELDKAVSELRSVIFQGIGSQPKESKANSPNKPEGNVFDVQMNILASLKSDIDDTISYLRTEFIQKIK